jgi:hypothetical protein
VRASIPKRFNRPELIKKAERVFGILYQVPRSFIKSPE